MRCRWIALSAVLAAATPAMAIDAALPSGGPILLPRDNVIACRAASTLRDAVGFQRRGDTAAAAKKIAISMRSGACTHLKQGEAVYLMASREGDELVSIRRERQVGTWSIALVELMTDAEVEAWHKARFGDHQVSRLARVCAALNRSPICEALYFNR